MKIMIDYDRQILNALTLEDIDKVINTLLDEEMYIKSCLYNAYKKQEELKKLTSL